MAKLDWSKAKKPRETESIKGEDLMRAAPRRKRFTKAQLRAQADRAYAEFQSRNVRSR